MLLADTYNINIVIFKDTLEAETLFKDCHSVSELRSEDSKTPLQRTIIPKNRDIMQKESVEIKNIRRGTAFSL